MPSNGAFPCSSPPPRPPHLPPHPRLSQRQVGAASVASQTADAPTYALPAAAPNAAWPSLPVGVEHPGRAARRLAPPPPRGRGERSAGSRSPRAQPPPAQPARAGAAASPSSRRAARRGGRTRARCRAGTACSPGQRAPALRPQSFPPRTACHCPCPPPPPRHCRWPSGAAAAPRRAAPRDSSSREGSQPPCTPRARRNPPQAP
mmetsp:Transcript_52961/g.164049  ORF Transcript_52961/g.164049 Transcript_52961/m.164049 type:complete len:204 (+) Transcript_52961:384-995(+)